MERVVSPLAFSIDAHADVRDNSAPTRDVFPATIGARTNPRDPAGTRDTTAHRVFYRRKVSCIEQEWHRLRGGGRTLRRIRSVLRSLLRLLARVAIALPMRGIECRSKERASWPRFLQSARPAGSNGSSTVRDALTYIYHPRRCAVSLLKAAYRRRRPPAESAWRFWG